MDAATVMAPGESGFLEPALHVGVVLPSGPQTDDGVRDPWSKVDLTLEALDRAVRQIDDARGRGPDQSVEGTLNLRFVALEPGGSAAILAAKVEARGWSCCVLRLIPREKHLDLPVCLHAFAIESTVEHEAEDRLALQTVFLDQIDLLIDFNETGHSLADVVLLRTARLASVPVLTAERMIGSGSISPENGADGIQATFLKALSFDDDASVSENQIREAKAFLKLTWDAKRTRRPDVSGQSAIASMQARLATILAHADEVAGRYGSRSRTIGMLRILLGAVATLGVFFAFYFADVMRSFWTGPAGAAQQSKLHVLETAGYGVDVLAIVAVLVLAGLAKRRPWSRRFAAARYVAEHLRHMPAMAALGNTVTRLRMPSSGARPANDWPTWYLRRVARSFGCPVGTLTAEDRRTIRREFDALVEDQIHFYQQRAHRFARLARSLSWLANGCYTLGLAAVLLRLAVFLQIAPDPKTRLLASLGTFLFPALGSVFVALRAQGEYVKLSKRYEATAVTLRETRRPAAPDQSFASLMDDVRGTVTAMLDEVGDWHVLFKSHTISPL